MDSGFDHGGVVLVLGTHLYPTRGAVLSAEQIRAYQVAAELLDRWAERDAQST